MLFLQDLPAEAVRGDLIETGQEEEILTKPCPAEYRELKEEEVTAQGLRFTLNCRRVHHHFPGSLCVWISDSCVG